jgi:hypothetical protein
MLAQLASVKTAACADVGAADVLLRTFLTDPDLAGRGPAKPARLAMGR